MSNNRKKISEADRRFIIGQSGGRCNLCRCELFIENEFGEKARLGDDAHIIADSELGARRNSLSIDLERDSANNLILLCKICHSKIDQQPQDYTIEKLLEIRRNHYFWVETCLGNKLTKRPKFHYLSYINIPRVDMYAVVNSISFPNNYFSFEGKTSIDDMGFNAGRLMRTYVDVLNNEELYAKEFDLETEIEHLEVGDYWFSAPFNFRTKKIPISASREDIILAWIKLESVIYRKFKNWTLYCLIDPRWITTSTALCSFKSGQLTITGIMNIKEIRPEQKTVIASPLFLGAPDNGFRWG